MRAARLRQLWADLQASFWLRPTLMALLAVILAEALVRIEGNVSLPGWLANTVYRGGVSGAREVLSAVASAMIGVAGTTFSITVAALTLASNQMGPRLLRNFTRDPGNQYALGSLLATFAYSLTALRSVREESEGEFVPQVAVSVALLLAFGCVGVLIWFLHHVASAINVDRVAALVYQDLSVAIAALPPAEDDDAPGPEATKCTADGPAGVLSGPGIGYLRVLDTALVADWAQEAGAVVRLDLRPGQFVFPGAVVGEVHPSEVREEAQDQIARAMSIGDSRSVEQDLEFAVRQLVEIALRALSPGINDPFTAIAVLDRLGAALCQIASHSMPNGFELREGRLRLSWPATDYDGLVDAMFHMLRQNSDGQPAVLIRLAEVLTAVAAVENRPGRRAALRRHLQLVQETGSRLTDSAAKADLLGRHERALAVLQETG